MPHHFISRLKEQFPEHPFTETVLADDTLCVYETIAERTEESPYRKYTIMEILQSDKRCFKIKNQGNNTEIAHICIDGDFIPYGQQKYNKYNPNFKEGRPDCILFNNAMLIFLELKLDQEDASFGKEDRKWKLFLDGAQQITDFSAFLKDHSFNIPHTFTQRAVVCMRFEPNFSLLSKGNAQRNKERFKISSRLGFEIFPHNHQEFFEL